MMQVFEDPMWLEETNKSGFCGGWMIEWIMHYGT